MKLRAVVALFVACVALAGVRGCPSSGRPDAVEERGRAWLAFRVATTVEVAVNTPSASWKAVRGPGGRWELSPPDGREIDPAAMGRFLGSLAELEIVREVADLGGERRAAGLDGSRTDIRIVAADGTRSDWTLGNVAPVGGGRYAQDGAGRIVLVDPSSSELLEAALERVIERRPAAAVVPGAATGIVLENEDRPTIRLARVEDRWRMQEPVVDRADDVAAEAALRALGALAVEKVESGGLEGEGGASAIEVRHEDRTAVRIVFGVRDAHGRARVWREGASWSGIARVPAGAPWDRSVWEFRSSRLVEVEPAAVRRAVVDRAGERFVVDLPGSTVVPGERASAGDSAAAREAVERLCRLALAGEADRRRVPDGDLGVRLIGDADAELAVLRFGPVDDDGLRAATTSTRPGFVFLVEDEALGGYWAAERLVAGGGVTP